MRRWEADEQIRSEFDPEDGLPFEQWLGELVLNGMLVSEGDEDMDG